MFTLKNCIAFFAIWPLALTGIGAAAGTVAFAADGDTAPTSGAQFNTLATSLLSEDGVQAVTTDGDNNVVLYTTEPATKIGETARSFAEDSSNVVVKVLDEPIAPYSTTDVVGGAGYASLRDRNAQASGFCSIGFSAWSPVGVPAVISAGHCAAGSTAVSKLTLPTTDTAGGGTRPRITQSLGALDFSQFGGPGNTTGANGSASSVDLSIFQVTNPALKTLPRVTDWTTAATNDLSTSSLPVRAVGAAKVGQQVSKSGRTTGFTSGKVESVGWAKVGGRQVSGFMTNAKAGPGDSGGAIIQGDRAVGVISGGSSAGGRFFTWGANLQNGLALTGGYTVALFLDAPTLTEQSTPYSTDTPVSGTGPAGGTLAVTPESGAPFEVPIDADGVWSFPAPRTEGNFGYSIVAKKGFDTSAATTFNIPVALAPPVITAPLDGQLIETSLKAISGTGEAGATVTLTGDVTATTTVDGAGNWSVPADLSYGAYTVNASQDIPETAPAVSALEVEPSAASTLASVSFQVGPVAPVINSRASTVTDVEGSGPVQVSGTGTNGAIVSVSVNGVSAGTATVANGAWALPVGGLPATGSVTITATQSIHGITGAASTSTITISAATPAAGTPSTPMTPSRTAIKYRGGKATVQVKATGFSVDGTARIYQGSKRLATVTVTNGKVTRKVPLKVKGMHKLYAVFAGTSELTKSTSPTIRVVIK
ncbi:hypothetical protein ITJ58_18335 [Curtobacterium flaccumfaciens]|uniref:S1 family peptidase n=1 Tax=Curtobacterium flaccumfaciens TaxID=2035 RepID=UPI00188A4DD1|nr:S1 family peptidase [Curtobacterium flaccumfaciens]MBF4595724.1 hypothetical protein [Curtobacterium flaccumfaciens]